MIIFTVLLAMGQRGVPAVYAQQLGPLPPLRTGATSSPWTWGNHTGNNHTGNGEARQALLEERGKAQLMVLAREWAQRRVQDSLSRYLKGLSGLWPAKVAGSESYSEFKSIRAGGLPALYNTTHNLGAAQTSLTTRLWPGGGRGWDLYGQRLTLCCFQGPTGTQPFYYDTKLGIWDGGAVRATHQELNGRVLQPDGASTLSNHATHVAGTMIASGVEPNARGMAYAAKLDAYDWNNDESEMAAAGAQGLLLSNHSYVLITGWQWGDYDQSGTDRWFWWGGETDTACVDFGLYSQQARDWDLIGQNAPNYLIVKAAGNDRGQGPAPGTTHRVWSNSLGNWTNSTTVRQKDGGPLGYDCISHAGVAKNVLTVGAVYALNGPYTDPSQVVPSTFHGWGPTDDGRIKPDIVAKGVSLYSSIAGNNQDYATYSGTSMASPTVTGTLALLQQRAIQVRNLLSSGPVQPLTSAQLKALVCHTAMEAGLPGPDPVYGWGLLNAEAAADLIQAAGDSALLESTNLANGATFSRTVYSDGLSPLKVTVAWTDPAASVSTYQLNNPAPVLVNDLDLRLIRQSDGVVFEPYRLVAGQPASPAQTGDNARDNIEQVRITAPVPGLYTVQLTHKGALSGNLPQAFALVGSGMRVKSILSGQLRYAGTQGNGVSGLIGVYRESDGQLVATCSTNAQGAYQITGLEQGTYKVRPAAWIQPSGVNGTDALQVARHFARTITLTGLALEAADVNASQVANSTDALQIALRFVQSWTNSQPMTLTYKAPSGSALFAASTAVVRLAAGNDSAGPATYTVGTWGSPSAPTGSQVLGGGRFRVQLHPLSYFGQASPQPFPAGQLPTRMEFLLRESGPCGGYGGVTRNCLQAGDATNGPVPMWAHVNPPLSGNLSLITAYGRYSSFAAGDWLGQEARISISSGAPATCHLTVQCAGDVDGSGF